MRELLFQALSRTSIPGIQAYSQCPPRAVGAPDLLEWEPTLQLSSTLKRIDGQTGGKGIGGEGERGGEERGEKGKTESLQKDCRHLMPALA